MHKIIIITILISCSIYSSGQHKEELNLLQADSTWDKETIQIPFSFAPEIKYIGQEDIRFAKGWGDINSPGFWTYAFVWDINLKTKPTTIFFEDNLKLYFDGLMNAVNQDTSITIPKTKTFFKEKEHKKAITSFKGTVETYDAFRTKKMMTLNVTIESYYCKKTKKFIPLFRFSPKDFKHKAWESLNQVTLRANICNNNLKDIK